MKKILSFLFLSIVGFGFSFANFEIQAVELKDSYIYVYGTGFGDYSQFYGKFEGIPLSNSKRVDNHKLRFDDTKLINNGDISISATNKESGEKLEDNIRLNVSKPLDGIYIRGVGDISSDKYDFNVNLYNSNNFGQNINIVANGKENLEEEYDNNYIKFSYPGLEKKLRIGAKIGEKFLNTFYHKKHTRDYGFFRGLEKVKRDGNIYNLYIKADENDLAQVYWNGEKLKKNYDYNFNQGYLVIKRQFNQLKKKNTLRYKTPNIESPTYHIYIAENTFKPVLEDININSNKRGEENILYGKNLDNFISTSENYILINGKKYDLSDDSYDKIYTDLRADYNRQLEIVESKKSEAKSNSDTEKLASLYSEEEDLKEKMNNIKDEIDGKVYGATFEKDSLKIDQPINYKTGENINTLQVFLNNTLTNKLKFKLNSDNTIKVLNSPVNLKDKLKVNFNGLKLSTGVNYENEFYNLGSVQLFSGRNTDIKTGYNNYLINKLHLKIKPDNDLDFLPVRHIKLGDKKGFIEKENDFYNVYFENIYVGGLSEEKLKLQLALSDNFEKFNAKIHPIDLDYNYLVNGTSSKKEFNKNNIVNISVDNNYTPCFDSNRNFEHCKTFGYTDKSHFRYSIKSSYSKDKENLQNVSVASDKNPKKDENNEEDDTVSNVQENENSVKNKEKNNKGEKESSNGLTNSQKKQVIAIIQKIDKFVSNKTSFDSQKAKIYKQVYTLLYNHYKNMGNSSKKSIIAGILHLTKNRYNKFK